MNDGFNYQAMHTVTGISKLKILRYLYRGMDGRTSQEIQDSLDMEQTQVAHNMQWLKQAGLVKTVKTPGKRRRKYHIADPTAVYAILSAEKYLSHAIMTAEGKK